MAYYKTGRSRTFIREFYGQVSYTSSVNFDPMRDQIYHFPVLVFTGAGAEVIIEGFSERIDPQTEGDPYYETGFYVKIALPQSSQTFRNLLRTDPQPYEVDTQFNVVANYVAQIRVETAVEWVEYSEEAGTTDDPPTREHVDFSWRANYPNATLSAIVTGDISGSLSEPLAGGTTLDDTTALTIRDDCHRVGSISTSVSVRFNDVGFSLASPYDHTDGVTTIHVAGGSASVALAPEGDFYATGEINVGFAPDRDIRVDGVVRAGSNPYPENLVAVITRRAGEPAFLLPFGGGAFSHGWKQRSVAITGMLNGQPTPPLIVAERSGVTAHIQPASLLTAGEDGLDNRLRFVGHAWNAFSITQAGSVVITSNPQQVTGGNNIEIIVSASAFPSSLKGSQWHGASMNGYRYLAVSVSASQSTSEKLIIGSKEWSLHFSTTNSSVVIDLCNPENKTTATDNDDSIYPFVTNPPYTASDGDYWGISNVEDVRISARQAGVTYTLHSIELRQSGSSVPIPPKLSMMQAREWIEREPPLQTGQVETRNYIRRFLDVDTTGKRSLEFSDYLKLVTSSTQYLPHSIADLGMAYNVATHSFPLDGFSVVAHHPAPNPAPEPENASLYHDFLNSSRKLNWAGSVYENGKWRFRIDELLGEKIAQARFDQLDNWIPYSNIQDDLFGLNEGAGGVIHLHCLLELRARVWGLTLNRHSPASGANVSLLEAPSGAFAGSGVSSQTGAYSTGLPYMKGTRSHTARCPQLTVATGSVTAVSRKRHRVCFKGSKREEGTSVCYEIGEHNRHYRAFVRNNSIWFGVADTLLPLVFSDIDTGITGTPTCLGVGKSESVVQIVMAVETSQNEILRISQSDGREWRWQMIISETGKYLRFVISRHAAIYLYWVDGQQIKGKIFRSDFTEMVSEFVAVGSGVSDAPIEVEEFSTPDGVHRIALGYSGDDGLIFVTSTDGKAFS